MALPDPVTMWHYLDGMEYPCGRQDLVRYAASCGAGDKILGQLSVLPDRSYDGPGAVHEALGADTEEVS